MRANLNLLNLYINEELEMSKYFFLWTLSGNHYTHKVQILVIIKE